jgi:hypothetical protein
MGHDARPARAGVVGADAVVSAPWLRAEVLRVLHKFAAGMPTLSVNEASAAALPGATRRDIRFMHAAGGEDLALLNACLDAERELQEREFATLERLLVYCQFADGALTERLIALPTRAFARAALDLYELGWIDREEDPCPPTP